MNHLPFGLPGTFYRGNLHTHSTRSDGARSPAEVIATYRDNGYDFLALTDHFMARFGYPIVDTREFRTPTFTTLIGAELHGPRTEVGEPWHILGVGLPLDFAPPTEEENGPAIATRAAKAGAFIGMAHPAWYSLTLADALSLESAHAVEVFNQTAVVDNDRGDSWYMSEMLAIHGRRLFAYAADDAHFRSRPDDRCAWVHVRATELEPEALVSALKNGHFYSSQGPLINNVEIQGRVIHIACSPADAVFVTGMGPIAESLVGREITSCSFRLERFGRAYARVTVVDATGKRAWTNPIWLE